MPLASLVPQVVVDPAQTNGLLPWGFYNNVIRPYLEPSGRPVPWTAELEAYYQTVHPLVWTALRDDDVLDASALLSLQTRIATLENGGEGDVLDDGATLEDLKTAFEFVTRRRAKRWGRLLALDIMRSRFLDEQQRENPSRPSETILAELPRAGNLPRPKAKPHSLWPIYILPPEDLEQTGSLICGWAVDAEWLHFMLPDQPSSESDDILQRSLQQVDSGGQLAGGKASDLPATTTPVVHELAPSSSNLRRRQARF